MAVNLEGTLLAVGGGLVGLGASLAQVDVNIDAPFLVAAGGVIGAGVKWVHGLWRTRRIFREQQLLNSLEHKNTLKTLSDKIDQGFKSVDARLDAQDATIQEVANGLGKATAAHDSLLVLLGELEGRTNARFEHVGR